jgi:hypothetical protein
MKPALILVVMFWATSSGAAIQYGRLDCRGHEAKNPRQILNDFVRFEESDLKHGADGFSINVTLLKIRESLEPASACRQTYMAVDGGSCYDWECRQSTFRFSLARRDWNILTVQADESVILLNCGRDSTLEIFPSSDAAADRISETRISRIADCPGWVDRRWSPGNCAETTVESRDCFRSRL